MELVLPIKVVNRASHFSAGSHRDEGPTSRRDFGPYEPVHLPGDAVTMPSHHIVLGVDGSPGAAAALEWCASFAGLFGAHVVAIHAVAPVLAGVLPPVAAPLPAANEQIGAMGEALARWCAPLRDAPLSYETRVVEGVPAGVLMQVADDVDALMVVVGRRGESGIAELVLGSVPRTLTHQSARPVLVVPG